MVIRRSQVGAIVVGCLFGLGGVLALAQSGSPSSPAASGSEIVIPESVAPPPQIVSVAIAGRQMAVPQSVTDSVDFDGSQLLGNVNGEVFVSGTLRETGEPCYVALPATKTPDDAITVGCDPRDQLVKKGGWLISRGDVGSTRSGLLIAPSTTGPLTFTTTPFEKRQRGSILTVEGSNGTYTIP